MNLTAAHKKQIKATIARQKKEAASMEPHVFDANNPHGILNPDLEPHVLTDKDEFKILPCRTCKRPCIVNRFAAPAKTACNDHRDRHSDPTKVVGDFDESKEEHVLTDKPKTKRVPCRHCRRPCIVTTFASPEKVACNSCRTSAPRPTKKVTIVKDENGRHREQVTMEFSQHDIDWSDFMLQMPVGAGREWTDDERKQAELLRIEQVDAALSHGTVKRERGEAEEALQKLPEKSKDEKVQKRIAKAEALVSELDQRETELADQVRRCRAERDQLARRAQLRWFLNNRYVLKGNTLRRGDTELKLPNDFIELEHLSAVKGR